MSRRGKPGLWVMEGPWSPRVSDVRTVTPVISALADAGRTRHVMHHVNDPEDLTRHLRRWGQAQHRTYGLGYLALHGAPGTVFTGRRQVNLYRLGEELSDIDLSHKTLHFGSCSVLQLRGKERQELRRTLGVKVLTGFTEDVDWFESMAFEVLLFDVLTYYRRPDFAERYIRSNYRELSRRLGFVMVR